MKMRCTVACTFDPRLVSLLLSRSFNWEILLTNQAVMWDPSLTHGAWRNVLSLPTFQHLREPTASKSTSVECFMQQKLLVVFSKMKCKKRYVCIFSSFLKECVFTVDGQITHCDVFLYIFLVFFLFFRKQKSTASGWQQKVCGSLSFLQNTIPEILKLQWWHNLITVPSQRISLFISSFILFC